MKMNPSNKLNFVQTQRVLILHNVSPRLGVQFFEVNLNLRELNEDLKNNTFSRNTLNVL